MTSENGQPRKKRPAQAAPDELVDGIHRKQDQLRQLDTNRRHAAAKGRSEAPQADPPTPEQWETPLPLDEGRPPPFPVERLPGWIAEWVNGIAEATQTPPDLAAALALAVVAAAIAGKFRVQVRPGWQEPTNLFFVVALLPGERKSAVFAEAIAPVLMHEKQMMTQMAPVIAAAKSEHRVIEGRLKFTEGKAAKATDPIERERLRCEAKQLAQELAQHAVPAEPQLFTDDVTPESLEQLLANQGGKMLQASPEGTPFEIAKGRYSETANFDVYLKGHAGDALRTNRVSRERSMVDKPALTLALAVQPDVIQGLADQTTMRGRGFLARWLYFMPASRVGHRKTAATAITETVKVNFQQNILTLWGLPGAVEDNKPAAHVLRFSKDADQLLQSFERWLEPQLAEGEELSYLAGWANKLAGAVARLAAVLHMAATASSQDCVSEDTVEGAIAIGREYLLPHAKTAFGLMGTDSGLDDAKALWASICKNLSSADSAHSAHTPGRFSRREAHNWNRRRFKTADDIDPALRALSEHNLIRPVPGSGLPGRGQSSPQFDVNPTALEAAKREAPRAHCAHSTPPNAEVDEDARDVGSPTATEENVTTRFDDELE